MKQEYTKEFSDRVAEIESMTDWRDIERAAEAVGITEKPGDQSWKEQAEAIALKEFERQDKLIYVADASLPDVKVSVVSGLDEVVVPGVVEEVDDIAQVLSTETPVLDARIAGMARMQANNQLFCEVCGHQLQTGIGGRPICPEQLDDCPRLQGDE